MNFKSGGGWGGAEETAVSDLTFYVLTEIKYAVMWKQEMGHRGGSDQVTAGQSWKFDV